MDTRCAALRSSFRTLRDRFSLAPADQAGAIPCDASAPTFVGDLAETSLCLLSQTLFRCIEEVTENAAAARRQLDEARTARMLAASAAGDAEGAATVEALAAAVEVELDEIAARKIASLEGELVAVDESLEMLQNELAAVAEAADRPLSQRTELESRVNTLRARLRSHPTEPVEPPAIGFFEDPSRIGRVWGVSRINAADLVVRAMPAYARPGETIHFSVQCIPPPYAREEPAVLEPGAVLKLARLLRIFARVESDAGVDALSPTVVADPDNDSVTVSLSVSDRTPMGAFLHIDGIRVAGALEGMAPGFPVDICVIGGLSAPFTVDGLRGFNTRPCSSPEGVLFLADEGTPAIRVFSSSGSLRKAVDVAGLGLSTGATVTAFDAESGTLFIGDKHGRRSKLVAVNPETFSVRWSAGSFNDCVGIAVLPRHRVVVACSFMNNALHVHRISDGARVATAMASSPSDITADPDSGVVFVACDSDDGDAVASWLWTGKALQPRGLVEAAGVDASRRLVAVLPPAPGRLVANLIVGTTNSRALRVLSLPGLQLAYVAALPSLFSPPGSASAVRLRHPAGGVSDAGDVWGIVGCASGTALMVCSPSTRHNLVALPWPLPELPAPPWP